MNRKILIVILPVVLGCSQGRFSASERKLVAETQEAYRTSWLRNDSTGVMRTLSLDVVLMPPGDKARRVRGRNAVMRFWFPKSDTSFVIRKFGISGEEVFGDGDMAFYCGVSELSWDVVSRDSVLSSSSSKSEFISAMKKERGEWKIFRQMWNVKK